MSGMGEAISDFIKGLYWSLGILAGTVLVLIGVIVWLLVK
jgi:hypothetical protein